MTSTFSFNYLGLLFSVVFSAVNLKAQTAHDSIIVNYDLGEVIVFESYPFKNDKEENKFQELEEDMEVVYPLLNIVRSEYQRVSKELSLYDGDREKAFLKWYENYAKESYMHHLSVLNPRQGRLFLKLISRELEYTPYDLIKEFRNDFRAMLWQGVARFFFANLKAEYSKDENPMIEYLMRKMDAENGMRN